MQSRPAAGGRDGGRSCSAARAGHGAGAMPGGFLRRRERAALAPSPAARRGGDGAMDCSHPRLRCGVARPLEPQGGAVDPAHGGARGEGRGELYVRPPERRRGEHSPGPGPGAGATARVQGGDGRRDDRLGLADLGCGPRAFRAQGSARGAQSGGPRRDRDPRGSGPGAGRRSVGHDGESRRLEAGDLEGFEDDRVWTRPPGAAVAGRRHARRRQADLAHPGPGDPDLEEGVEANVFPSTGRSCWWSTSIAWRRAG